ncbi:hypothetical protein [Paraburkholderia youngii]|uniref:Uncharacterized protein n=1 Tax=Paraburkholderia youngii TaxID=2782701 RepID=A0A7Y6JVF2_9BURK|nr:hypothetical protein [Paraburkholderia youngii]NUX98835.1 hypothetical protein [Paraburkholderia youngii]
MKNGQEIGQDYVEGLRAFFKAGGPVPLSSDGVLNLAELSRLTRIPKCSFYQNSRLKECLDEHLRSNGISRRGTTEKKQAQEASSFEPSTGSAEPSTSALERRIQQLQQRNAILVAEVGELRAQISQLRLRLGREDMMLESGRRIAIPGARA